MSRKLPYVGEPLDGDIFDQQPQHLLAFSDPPAEEVLRSNGAPGCPPRADWPGPLLDSVVRPAPLHTRHVPIASATGASSLDRVIPAPRPRLRRARVRWAARSGALGRPRRHPANHNETSGMLCWPDLRGTTRNKRRWDKCRRCRCNVRSARDRNGRTRAALAAGLSLRATGHTAPMVHRSFGFSPRVGCFPKTLPKRYTLHGGLASGRTSWVWQPRAFGGELRLRG